MTEPRFSPGPPDPEGDAERAEARRGALATVRDAIRSGEYERARRELDAFEAAFSDPSDSDPLEGLDEAGTPEALRRILERADPGPDVLAAPAFGAPLPRPVLWRAGSESGRGALIGAGEVAVLAGPGQGGKSTVALALARAAREGGTACGLHVARGRVAVLSYEDSPARLAARMEWYGARDEWAHVRTAPAPAPLWTADPEDRRESGPSAWWPRLWDALADFRPALVVIDPASVAFAGAHPSDGAAVRAFLLAVTEEADRTGAGVLILAHDTKGARNETRAGHGPGAGMVSGSAQWFDGARAVLHLSGPGPDEKRLIVAEKSNYGPSGWGARLAPRWDGDRWRGLALDSGEPMLSRGRVKATRKQWARGPDAPKTSGKANGRTAEPEDWRRTAQR